MSAPRVPSAGSAATSGRRRKNAGCRARQISISTTPSSRKPRPITSGGPSPNHESPDSEFAGLERSKQDLTKMPGEHQPAERRADADQQEVFSDAQSARGGSRSCRRSRSARSRRRSSGPSAAIESNRMFSRDDRQPDVPDDRQDAHQDRRHVRREVARVHVARATPASRRARAIDSDVRAVGRIVVCVDAAADVSTAMIRILSSGDAEHLLAEHAEHVVGVVDQRPAGRRRPARRSRRSRRSPAGSPSPAAPPCPGPRWSPGSPR